VGARDHRGDWGTWAFLWDQAVQRQADRILGAELEDAQVDAMLFANAVRNVLRSAERVLGKDHPAIHEFLARVPNAVHVRDMFEHFDEYVEGVGRRQRSGQVGPRDWIPLHTKVGDEFFAVRFGPYTLEIVPAREASSQLLVATLDAADHRGESPA